MFCENSSTWLIEGFELVEVEIMHIFASCVQADGILERVFGLLIEIPITPCVEKMPVI